MTKFLSAVIVVLALVGSEVVSKGQPDNAESDVIKTLHLSPSDVEKEQIAKYQRMAPERLRAVLKDLQKTIILSERKVKDAGNAARAVQKAYNASSDEQKPDALLRMIEAEAATYKLRTVYEKDRMEFNAAQKAYLNLLIEAMKPGLSPRGKK